MRLSNLAKMLDDRKFSSREPDYLVLSRGLSSFFKDLVILPKTLLPTYFESKSLGAFHIFAMIMHWGKMNLVTFWLWGISKGFGGAPVLPRWREPWFGPPIDLTIINIMGPPGQRTSIGKSRSLVAVGPPYLGCSWKTRLYRWPPKFWE